jgi:hypothetical protein
VKASFQTAWFAISALGQHRSTQRKVPRGREDWRDDPELSQLRADRIDH